MLIPTDQDRFATQLRPPGLPVMRQRWSRLLFLHWPVSVAEIQATLPPGLHVDTFGGSAWLGVVPFYMERVRPVLLPPVPGLSWFRELNVRTYVHDDRGVPGVWFHSLDCDQAMAVGIARRFFHLPYQHAQIEMRHDGKQTDYRCLRKGVEETPAHFIYEDPRSSQPATPGTLEWFLVERYVLFSATPSGKLKEGRVHHPPYRISPVACQKWSAAPVGWNGMQIPTGPPVSMLVAEPVDVTIFPLKTL
jgi:uncharacterized protein